MDTEPGIPKVATKSAVPSKVYLVLIVILVVAAILFLISEVKCHYSGQSGAHCHSLSEKPHIHPFADH